MSRFLQTSDGSLAKGATLMIFRAGTDEQDFALLATPLDEDGERIASQWFAKADIVIEIEHREGWPEAVVTKWLHEFMEEMRDGQ